MLAKAGCWRRALCWNQEEESLPSAVPSAGLNATPGGKGERLAKPASVTQSTGRVDLNLGAQKVRADRSPGPAKSVPTFPCPSPCAGPKPGDQRQVSETPARAA